MVRAGRSEQGIFLFIYGPSGTLGPDVYRAGRSDQMFMMEEDKIKKLIAKSDLQVDEGFTDRLMNRLAVTPKPMMATLKAKFWPLWQILLGFLAVLVTSVWLLLGLKSTGLLPDGVLVPFAWFLLLLLALSYLLSIRPPAVYLDQEQENMPVRD